MVSKKRLTEVTTFKKLTTRLGKTCWLLCEASSQIMVVLPL